MAYITLIVMLALIQYLYFGVAVGRARGRHGVSAPAISGDETFERFHRAHQNTLEQLVVFIPASFAAAYFANDLIAVAIGVVYLVGRAYYFRSYISDPQSRGTGMIITMVANIILIGMAMVGAMRAILFQ
ncbi:MAG: MAPEG family protein [Pseudomonadota bacterium]